jgi:hypothetical protein
MVQAADRLRTSPSTPTRLVYVMDALMFRLPCCWTAPRGPWTRRRSSPPRGRPGPAAHRPGDGGRCRDVGAGGRRTGLATSLQQTADPRLEPTVKGPAAAVDAELTKLLQGAVRAVSDA